MKFVAFNGSPRGKNSHTEAMVEEFLAGAEEAGAEVENVLLAEKSVAHCKGCFACWVATPGVCVIEDDMAELLEKLRQADVAVYATPLYTDVVSGLLKDFMDRSIPLLDPHFVRDERGETRHPLRYDSFPKMVVMSNCGFPEQSHFQVLSLLFRREARNLHSEVPAEIYRGRGGLLKADAEELQPLIAGYKSLLRKAGHEIAENLALSDETREALGRPLAPPDIYVEHANRGWDAALSGKS
jgi:multimeric flavodoxin WrbA